ncbi:hypothetical protein SAY86_024067 [Trapa natans]|uniref:Non-structural maintenance of chromosomes element 4 n=1 Tax=Trapa natans TaxID=22666 RepID=A0AAN7LVV9_TRANT|nr:hypothetical protein SAY86_024067 [Trapa natans]
MRREDMRKAAPVAGPSGEIGGRNADEGRTGRGKQDESDRRFLRSQYLALKSRIHVERDDLLGSDSDKFATIIKEVENLHQLVDKPREQVADAEALLDISNALITSVRSFSSEGATPLDFITGLLKDFGQSRIVSGASASESDQISVRWKDLGLSVSTIFQKGYGCCTMLGPMDTQLKQRKVSVRQKDPRPTECAQPEKLDSDKEEKMDTDKNMLTMFEILRKQKIVRLENLILNRTSFAQTVENLFALSFLVKDGRAEISVDKDGTHFVCMILAALDFVICHNSASIAYQLIASIIINCSDTAPRNAPAAGKVAYSHFVFRFDFLDWKFMLDKVAVGEELMPHRQPLDTSSAAEPAACDPEAVLHTTPILKLTRNRGLVVQEETMLEDTPKIGDDDPLRSRAIGKRKRKHR